MSENNITVSSEWEGYKLLFNNRYEIGGIYEAPWYQDLKETILQGKDLEEFIAAKEEKRYAAFLTYDEEINNARNVLANTQTKEKESAEQVQKIKNFQDRLNQTQAQIKDVIKTFPPSKQKDIEALMQKFSRDGTFDENLLNKIQKPESIMDKLKNNGKYKQGSKKLTELMAFCQENKKHLPEESFSSFLSNAYNQKDIDCSKQLENAENLLVSHQKIIDNANKRIENRKKEFMSATEENDNIRDFVSKNKELLISPPQMTDAAVKDSGLTQQYVEGAILGSKYPNSCFRSIRQFYEGLNAPAAPRLAYNGRASKAESGEDIKPEDMVAKLRAQGLNAVLSTDEKASDPHVFVVSHDSVYAPFLDPKEALKANIAIIEATRDLGGHPSLSNPQMRESMVKAAEPDTKENLSEALVDTYSKNKKHNHEQLSFYLQGITSEWSETKTSYSNLSNILNKLQTENPQLYNAVVQDISNGYNKLNTSGQWNFEAAENLAQDILKTHKEQLNPYIFDMKQADMVHEAFEQGEPPYELDRRAKEFMATNGYPESVFHAGKQGANPYAVLCSEKEGNMCMVYGATTVVSNAENNEKYNIHGDGCLGYAFGMSSHTKRKITAGKYEIGFLYEYEARKEKQEMQLLDIAADYRGGKFDLKEVNGLHDETAILPHQNKLKKIYLAMEDTKGNSKLFPLEIDENGQIKDKKWRDFVEMYNPVNDNLSGKMVERQNNMIAEYDSKGKDNMYRTLEQLDEKLDEPKQEKNIDEPDKSASIISPQPESILANDNLTQKVQTSEPPQKETVQDNHVADVLTSMRMGHNPLLEQQDNAEQKTIEKEPQQMAQEAKLEDAKEAPAPAPVAQQAETTLANDNLVQEPQTAEISNISKEAPAVGHEVQGNAPQGLNNEPTSTYSEAADALIEQRAKLSYEYANPNGMVTEAQKEDIKRRQEHEKQMAKVITKVMDEKGPDLFANNDSKKVEAIFREQALKDGLLVESNHELFGKSVDFSNGSVYLENDAGFYSLAVGIAKQKMDMELAKQPPERQEEAMKGFYSCKDATQQAAFAMSTISQLPESHVEDKNIGKNLQQMRMGNNPHLEQKITGTQRTQTAPVKDNTLSAAIMNQMAGAQR